MKIHLQPKLKKPLGPTTRRGLKELNERGTVYSKSQMKRMEVQKRPSPRTDEVVRYLPRTRKPIVDADFARALERAFRGLEERDISTH